MFEKGFVFAAVRYAVDDLLDDGFEELKEYVKPEDIEEMASDYEEEIESNYAYFDSFDFDPYGFVEGRLDELMDYYDLIEEEK